MARVLIATQGWGWVVDSSGNPRGGVSVTIRNLDGSNATHWSAVTGGSSSTAAVLTNANGTIPRYIEEGTYEVTVATDAAVRVEAASGSSRRDLAPLNVVDYGADKTGATDSTTAFAAAVAALPATGGTIDVPAGVYLLTSLSLFGLDNVTLRGEGGPNRQGGFGTVVIFTDTGATRLLDARQTIGLRVMGCQLIYNNSGFTGTFVDCANDSGSGANDTTNAKFQDVGFFGSPATGGINAAALVGLENAHTVGFDNCVFMRGQVGVNGRALIGDYCNTIRFHGCLFMDNYVAHVKNADGSWLFEACTFEPLVTAIPGAYKQDFVPVGGGLTFISCWFGDATANGAGAGWIEWSGPALLVAGCTIASEHANNKHIVITGNGCKGIVVKGNSFIGPGTMAVDFGATTGHLGVDIGPNAYDANVATYGGTPPTTAISFSKSTGKMQFGNAASANLYQDGAGVAGIKTDGYFAAAGVIYGGVLSLTTQITFSSTIAAAAAPNNTMFRDTADNVIKIKDNAGVVQTLY